MRTFHIAALAVLAAVSESVVAHGPGMMESFDTSILNARSGLPNTVPMVARANIDNNSSVKLQKKSEMVRVTKKRDETTVASSSEMQKRGDDEAEEECEADEDDDANNDEEDCEEEEEDDGEDEEDCDEEESSDSDQSSDNPVLPTSSIRNAAAAVPTSSPAPAPSSEAAPAKPSSGGDKATGPVQKPSNIADDSFTPSEGCIRYHTVLEGEVCLGVLDGSKDLGLTLDQFYCLNPGVKEGCSNLTTGKAYCTGYSGEWPQ